MTDLILCKGIYGVSKVGELHLNESVEEMAGELRVGNKFRLVAFSIFQELDNYF